MALKRRIKAPKVFQGTPGKEKRYAKSSTKTPRPQGIQPGKPAYGLLHGGNQSTEVLTSKASRMFGNGSRNTPTGQETLTKKVKRQAY